MKKHFLSSLCSAVVAASLLALGQTVGAGPSARAEVFKKELKAVKAAELPAHASKLVARSAPEERETAAQAVVVATHAVRPVALVPVVGALAREFPALAPAAAAKAATLRPKEAGIIARAAAAAAPAQAVEIARAVAKAVPSESAVIAAGVAQVAPQASKEAIWAAVSTADSSSRRATATAPNGRTVGALAPPVVGPPFTPLPPTPTEINRTNSIEVPPGGGRDYSGP